MHAYLGLAEPFYPLNFDSLASSPSLNPLIFLSTFFTPLIFLMPIRTLKQKYIYLSKTLIKCKPKLKKNVKMKIEKMKEKKAWVASQEALDLVSLARLGFGSLQFGSASEIFSTFRSSLPK